MTLSPRTPRRVAVQAGCLLVVLACSRETQDAAIRRLVPSATETFALDVLDTLRVGTLESVQRLLVPPLDTMASVRDSLARIRAAFPAGAPERIELANFSRIVYSDAPARTEFAYQIRNAAGVALAELVIVEDSDQRRVESVRVSRLPVTLQAENAFTLAGKGPAQWFALLMTIVVVLFSALSAVRVARTRGMPRRWLWAFVACVGVGKVVFNWTNGAVSGQLVAIQLFGAAASRIGLLGPWLIAFSFPVGAIVALERRSRFLRAVVVASEPLEAQSKASSEPDAPVAL